MNEQWDPEGDANQIDVTDVCVARINKDLRTIYSDPPPGICVIPDENDITKVYALITGPFDTPYEGGFFLFYIRFPSDYPLNPPKVKLKTTGNGSVRFNPNLYKNGKVCLSLLGTWDGPPWSPVSSLSSILISIQSLMNDRPYFNEPGFLVERSPGDSRRYNDIIQHETIRCAVCDVLEGLSWCPEGLMSIVKTNFSCYYDHYVDVCEKNLHLSGQKMDDPDFGNRGTFDYTKLLRRLKSIHSTLDDLDSSEDLSATH